ncbi:MAG: FG-GAP repeat domain-containing protein [Myxococcota bacterium]
MFLIILACVADQEGSFALPLPPKPVSEQYDVVAIPIDECQSSEAIAFTEQGANLGFEVRLDPEIYHDDGPQVAALDIDSDGLTEVLSCFLWEPLFIYDPQPNGTVTHDWVSDFCGPMAVIDLDQDGDDDILLSSETDIFGDNVIGLLPLWAQDGHLSHGTLQSFDGGPARNLRLGHFNADSHLDAVILRSGQSDFDAQDFIAWGEGNGQFTFDYSVLGSVHTQGKAFDGAVYDFDGNGWDDIMVVNDMGSLYGGNVLWWNDSGAFDAASEESGVRIVQSAMGLDVADFNGDGLLDMVSSDATKTILLQGMGDGAWADVTQSLNANLMAGFEMGWGVRFVDMANDGQPEIILAQGDHFYEGAVDVEYEGPMTPSVASWSGGQFEEVASELGFDEEGSYRAVLPIHWNNDGIMDYWISEVRKTPLLYVSEGCTGSSYLYVQAPEGTYIRYEQNGKRHSRRISGSSSYAASISPQIQIGFGEQETLQQVAIKLPRTSKWHEVSESLSLPHHIHVSRRTGE